MEFKQPEKLNWREEFKRLKRWIHRIENTHDSDREDFLIAFLQCCYHFKDWLEKDGIAEKKVLNQYVDDNYSLSLCADVCNVSKHGKSDRFPRLDPNTEVIGQKLLITPPAGSSYHLSALKIKSQGKKIYDAFNIGKECVDAWAHFLTERGHALPAMVEEVIFLNYKKWQQKWKPESEKLLELRKKQVTEAVIKFNDLELALYKEPGNQELMTAFQNLVVPPSPIGDDIIARVKSAHERKIKIDSSTATHTVEVVGAVFYGKLGDSVEIKTLETSYWQWSNGYSFRQQKRPHLYTLFKIGSEWKIKDENRWALMEHAGF